MIDRLLPLNEVSEGLRRDRELVQRVDDLDRGHGPVRLRGLGGMGGPIGLGAGAIGLLGGAAFAAWQQSAEQTRQVVASMFDEMIASGQRCAFESLIQSGVHDIIGDEIRFKQAKTLATETGLSVGQALRDLAGDTDAARAAQDALNAAQAKVSEEQNRIAEVYRTTEQADIAAFQANSEHIETLGDLQAALAGTADAQTKAVAQADAYRPRSAPPPRPPSTRRSPTLRLPSTPQRPPRGPRATSSTT